MNRFHIYIIATAISLLPLLVNSQPVLGVNNANINVVGNMSMKGGFQATGSSSVFLNGSMTLYDNTGLGGAGSWIDFTTAGVIANSSIGSVIMNGNLSSGISGNSVFPILHINAIGGVGLNNHVSVTNLVLTQGRLSTGAYRLIVNNYADSAIAAGTGNTNFANGWVYGNLRRSFNSTNTNYHFPVGNAARGNLIKLINNNANPLTGITYIDASFGAKRGNDNNLSLIVGTKLYDSINTGGVWYVTPNNQPTSGNYTLQAYFNGFTGLKNKKFDLLRRADSSSVATDWQVPTNSSLDAADTRLVSNGYAKRTNISTFSQFAIAQASAVSLMVKAEYFFDIDPGFGNATDIPLTYGLDISNKDFSANINSLNVGIHKLYIRTQDGDEVWSNTYSMTFYKQALNVTSDIVKAEYFFDTDPGFSNGSDIPVTQAVDIANLNFAANISSLPAGIHKMFVRTKNAAGIWSVAHLHLFYNAHSNAPLITEANYYFDGNSNNSFNIPITQAADIIDLNVAINTTSLSNGIHRMYLRTKDNEGKWSVAHVYLFYKTSSPISIVKVEYYIDNNALIDVPVTQSTDIIDLNFSVNISSLPIGLHKMYLRTKDAEGKWSVTNVHLFYKSANSANPNITQSEYFFDTDPGFGNGTSLAITPSADISDAIFTINISALTVGNHKFFLRTKDADGKWSITNYLEFINNQSLPVSWLNFTADAVADNVLLKWMVANEINVEQYTIEHSLNGVTFNTIGIVAANQLSNYQFTHIRASANKTNYYRIKQIDKDGKFTYTAVRIIKFDGKSLFVIAPNPAHDFIKITTSENNTTLYLFDEKGSKVLTALLINTTTTVAIEKLAAGLYVAAIVKDGKIIETKKLLKQ